MMQNKIYVWDPLVRLFHWSLVLTFIICYITGEEESLTHVYSGYVIFGLVAFRLLWGLIGTKHARFSDFIVSPAKTLRYTKDLLRGKVEKHIGHNPAGGWMIVALLISLLLTGLSGLQVYGLEGYGPLASNNIVAEKQIGQENQKYGRGEYDDDDEKYERGKYDDDDEYEHNGYEKSDAHESDEEAEDFWEEIHEFLANLTVFLIALHIAGVFVSSLRENQNLIKAMMTGYKKADVGRS